MDPVKRWMDRLANRAEGTKVNYKIYFTKFLKFTGLKPEQLLEDRDDIEILFVRFDAHLKEKGYAPGTRKNTWVALRSFFTVHGVQLKLTRSDAPRGESAEMRAATKQEIVKVLKICGIRERALITLAATTGLRASDMAGLDVGDVDLESEYPLLKFRTRKKGIIVKTFLSLEAQQSLKDYLGFRCIGTEKIPPEAVTDGSPLFRIEKPEVLRMGSSSIVVIVRKRMHEAGLRDISAHSLRRYFQTALEAGGVHPTWIDRMTGHRPAGARGSYSKPTETQLRESYIKAYHFLSLEKPATDNARLDALEEQLEEKTGFIEHLLKNGSAKSAEIEEMKQRLSKLESEYANLTIARKKSDQIMDKLFEDPEFKVLLKRKLRELNL